GTLHGTSYITFKTFVYFGDGAGGFPAARVKNFVVPWPTNIEIADFNNDGTPDIGIASAAQLTLPSKIVVALSDGAGAFVIAETPTDSIRNTLGRFPLASADFDGDGNQDLALTVRGQNWITLYFGNGLGGFFHQLRVPTGIGETTSLSAADYDEDGDIDIIASGATTAAVVLFQSDGRGGLVVDETVPVGSVRLASVRAGDFNNDGAPDIQTGDLTDIHVLLADRRAERRFASPGADFSVLDRTPSGGYIRRMTDGTVVEYNEDGLMTARVDANGNRTDYAYDGTGLLTGISDPADPTRNTVFDYSGGNLSGITDLAGRTSYFQVDGDGNLVSFADVESNVFRYAYDGDSRLSAFASARGFVTGFDYGSAGQYLGTSNPDGTSVTASVTGSLGLVDPGLATGDWIAPEDRIATMQDAKGNIYEFEV
ncbi:MAG: VCBS repeat-containing protein, partial [Alphaproteobacteria bacterium]|nr:VCBS repeat-containing protein [Alphaproteobacteria bacterium]